MPSLQKADDRFMHRIEVIENGSGFFKGIIDEPQQGSIPSTQFINARRVLRVNPQCPIRAGMVIRTANGSVFIVGTLGDSEDIFKSFRLIETTGQYSWKTRVQTVELITGLEEDTGLVESGPIWGSYEPSTVNGFDRQIHATFPTGKFLTNRPVSLTDMVDNKRVTQLEHQLGITVATLV